MAKEKVSAAVEETIQIVSFLVGREAYGLGINAVAEVLRPLIITPLPRMPAFVEGVINLRGTIIPVIDMRKRFELKEFPTKSRKMRMVITRGAVSAPTGKGYQMLGLIVDEVRDVFHLPKRNIEEAPEAARGPNADFILGMGKVNEQIIILLEIAKILSHEERAALEEAGNGDA